MLSKVNAQKIVQELSGVIGHKINIMDEKGQIIASSDSGRLGTYHEGARRLLRMHLQELIIHSDQEYEGCREGVNYPIVIGRQTLGVVGITGPYREAVKYGQIIQRMTGILLREVSVKEQKALDEKIRNRFVEEWLTLEESRINQTFVERGREMQMDITVPRRVIAFAVSEEDHGMTTILELKTAEKALDDLKKIIKEQEPDSIYMASVSRLICAVPDRSDEQMGRLARLLKSRVQRDNPIRIAVGIDDGCHSWPRIGQSSAEAQKALQMNLKNRKKEFCFYHDIGIELFSDEISDLSKVEYIRHIFREYSKEELGETIYMLEIFYGCEGSLKQAAEQLHMHKNTLQYRLLKVRDRTGYDPRSLKDAALFFIAANFYKEIRTML